MRTCLGCGTRDRQDCLLRLVVDPSGKLKVQDGGPGRGGYVHKQETCWESCLGNKKFYRAFHMEISREARIKLIQELRERNWENADE